MKKLLTLLTILAIAGVCRGGLVVNTNILIVSGSGNSNDNTWFFYTTNLWFVNGATGFTNPASAQLYYNTNSGGGGVAWEIITNGGSVFFEDYFNLAASPQGGWTLGFSIAPPPTIAYWSANTLTNWTQAASNYWRWPNDSVTFSASGRNFSSGVNSNQLLITLDGNAIFTGPWSAAGGFAWYVTGTVTWDGANLISIGQFTSGDTNNPIGYDQEMITSAMVGTNVWGWVVLGDTNGLTFDSASISAARASTNDTPSHIH